MTYSENGAVHRLTAHICSAPDGRFGLRHIFTFAIATVKNVIYARNVRRKRPNLLKGMDYMI